MELHVSAALRRIGEEFPFSYTLAVEEQTYGGRPLAFEQPLAVEGAYVFDGKAFTLKADVRTILHSTCARCAEEFPEELAFSLEERFERGAQEDDESDIYPYEGDILDPDMAVLDNLYLNLPLISFCKPDCKGLCPVCGANRNYTVCGCQEPGKPNAFAALKNEF